MNLTTCEPEKINATFMVQVSFEHFEVDSPCGRRSQHPLLLFLPHCQGPACGTRHAQSNHLQVARNDLTSQSRPHKCRVSNIFLKNFPSLMTVSVRRSFKSCYNRNLGKERREKM